MSTTEEDQRFRELCNWYAGDAEKREPKDLRWLVFYIIGVCLIAAAFMFAGRAEASDLDDLDVVSWALPVVCSDGSAPTVVSGLKATRVMFGTSSAGPWTTLVDVAPPQTQYWRRDVPPGTWHYAARAVMENGDLSEVLISKMPAPVTRKPAVFVVIAPEVYNTGTFDPADSWLVKRNKLYGTVPLGTECDASKPAKDGYYRVPGTLVRWTNPRAKTSFPVAKCERKA